MQPIHCVTYKYNYHPKLHQIALHNPIQPQDEYSVSKVKYIKVNDKTNSQSLISNNFGSKRTSQISADDSNIKCNSCMKHQKIADANDAQNSNLSLSQLGHDNEVIFHKPLITFLTKKRHNHEAYKTKYKELPIKTNTELCKSFDSPLLDFSSSKKPTFKRNLTRYLRSKIQDGFCNSEVVTPVNMSVVGCPTAANNKLYTVLNGMRNQNNEFLSEFASSSVCRNSDCSHRKQIITFKGTSFRNYEEKSHKRDGIVL